MKSYIPINKGNYSLDTSERERNFNRNRAFGVEEEYTNNRREWEEFPKNFYIAKYPLLVDLELSSICNLKCPFCYTITKEFKKKVKATRMNFSLYKKIIDEISEKVFAIRLSFRGEPTLHSNFIDAIKYAKLKNIKEISTLTNGSILTSDFFEQCLLAGIDWITISFDGLGEEYEKNRFPLKFKTMYNRLKSFVEIKAKHKTVKPVIKVQTIWPAIKNNPEQYYNTMASVCDLVAFNPLIDFTYSAPINRIEYIDNFSCPQHYQRIVVGSDGKVMMCSNDEESSVVIGDANKETIYDIWHGEKFNAIRKLHKQKNGFLKVPVCTKCYLPRATEDKERAAVNGREFIVKNYINRRQNVGE